MEHGAATPTGCCWGSSRRGPHAPGCPIVSSRPRAEAEAGHRGRASGGRALGRRVRGRAPEHRLAPGLAALAAAEPYRLLAQRLVAEGRPAEAAIALARAIELAPFDAASRVNRANALRARGRPRGALAELEEAEWAYSNDPAFHRARGRVLESLEEPDRAIVAYERALARRATASCSTGSRALGALRRLSAPMAPRLADPGRFRSRRARRAGGALRAGRAQLVARGVALAADGHLELARLAGLLATRLDPEDERRRSCCGSATGRGRGRDRSPGALTILVGSDPERFRPGRPEQTPAPVRLR